MTRIATETLEPPAPATTSAARAPRRAARAGALLLGLALALIAIELALQAVAFVLWIGSGDEAKAGGRVVLCIGDSLTFGLGAGRTESYPARLEAALRQRDATWSVVNAGIPGQSSADVAARLPGLLGRHRPEVLCLLVGVNDRWARPKQLTREQLGSDGFPLRWRTGRVIDLVLARWRSEDTHAGAHAMPFLGTWRAHGQTMQFAADGTARLGDVHATWKLAGDDLELTPVGGAPFLVRWRASERGIDFALHGWHRFHRARRGMPDADAGPDEFDEALDAAALDEAQRILTGCRGTAAELGMQAQLCLALRRAGRHDEALVLLREVESAWQQRRVPVAGEGVARWRAETGDRAAAVAIAEAVVAAANDRVGCWRVLVDHGSREGRTQLEQRIAAAAAAQTSSWRQAELIAERAVLLAARSVDARADADAAIAALLVARDRGIGSDESIAVMSRAVALGADRAALLAAVGRVDGAPGVRESLERDVRRATVTDAEMIAVLGQHVRMAVEVCRAKGTRVVLIGYPFAMPQHEHAMREIARSQRVPFVSLVGEFDAVVAQSTREEWFVDEIHCTARGYELMARVIAEGGVASGR